MKFMIDKCIHESMNSRMKISFETQRMICRIQRKRFKTLSKDCKSLVSYVSSRIIQILTINARFLIELQLIYLLESSSKLIQRTLWSFINTSIKLILNLSKLSKVLLLQALKVLKKLRVKKSGLII